MPIVPSEDDDTDLLETVDVEGVEVERSSDGQAPMASEGETDGEGEEGRCMGEDMLLDVVVSAMFSVAEGLSQIQSQAM